MALDDEDAPKGEIIALVLVASIVVIILVLTFESCADFEMGDSFSFCRDVIIELGPPLGENTFCFNLQGEVEFSILNRGTIPLEGIAIQYKDTVMNLSIPMRSISQENFKIDLGLRAGQEFTPINITPIVFFEPRDREILCEPSMQRIMRLVRCGLS